MKKLLITTFIVAFAFLSTAAFSAWDKDDVAEYDPKAKEALAAFLEADPGMQKMRIGGARGKGLLYENGKPTAVVTLSQLSIGFQWGGQAYSEYILFQDSPTLSNFKKGNYELGAQVSAVAVTAGVSADAAFVDGMAIFTQAKGGLMYEASVGGQKFKVELQ